jgi:Flp pilus assembly protein TadD/4-amino-4-deoxy-L-arabinose transferase-like glycosyltransferase
MGKKKQIESTTISLAKPKVSLWRRYLPLLLILGLALFIRILYINELAQNPFFNYPIVDSDSYDQMAQKIVLGKAPTAEPFFQPPLYPYFMSFLYLVFGRDFFWVRFAQMLMGVINVLMTYTLAKRLFSSEIAIAAGVVAALYGTMLFYEGELLAPVLIVFINLLLLLSLDWFLQAPRWHKALLAGILLGASAIAMTVVLPFALVIAVYALLKLRRGPPSASWSKLLLWGGIFAVGMALPIVPVAMYNASQNDSVLISYNGGINFYIGTGKDYDQKVGIRPGFEWQALAHEPIFLGHKRTSEQSSYFMQKGIDSILADPIGYIGLLGRKFYLFSNGNEIMRNQEMYPFRQYSPLLAMLVWKWGIAFPFGVLFPLAIVGAILALRTKQRRTYPMLLFIISYILVIILFFVAARYRMNIVPFLIVLAVYAVWQVAAYVREKKWGKTAWAGAGFAVLMVFCNWDVGVMPAQFNADAYYNLGVGYMHKGKPEAAAMFAKALELDPDYPEANDNLGIYLDQQGKPAEALEHYKIVLRQYPNDINANLNMGNAYFNLGDWENARKCYLKVLEVQPGYPDAIYNLRLLDSKMKSAPPTPTKPSSTPQERIAQLQAQLRSDPNNPMLLINLGADYLALKDYPSARPILKRAVQGAPNIWQAHNNYGIALAETGSLTEAKSELEAALKLSPNNPDITANLADVNRRLGLRH